MIRPLRRVHLWMFVLLAVLLPLLLAVAIAGRSEVRVQHVWPFEDLR